MFLEKLLMILLQAKEGVLAIVLTAGTVVAVTGAVTPGRIEAIDVTVHPAEGTPTTTRITLPTPTPSASATASPTPVASASPTAAPTASPRTVSSASCSAEAARRDAALVELAAAGAQAADVLRVAGTVALGNGSDRKAMRGVLKEAGHEVRDALKDAMHEVRDAAKRILGDCDEANAEGLVSRLEHDLDEVAEVHEEFERALSRAPAPVVVTIPARTSELADPYRAVVEGAIRDVERELADLNSEIAKLRSR